MSFVSIETVPERVEAWQRSTHQPDLNVPAIRAYASTGCKSAAGLSSRKVTPPSVQQVCPPGLSPALTTPSMCPPDSPHRRKLTLHLPARWPRQTECKTLWNNVIGYCYPTAQPRAPKPTGSPSTSPPQARPRNHKESWYRRADHACANAFMSVRGSPNRRRPDEITDPRIQAKSSAIERITNCPQGDLIWCIAVECETKQSLRQRICGLLQAALCSGTNLRRCAAMRPADIPPSIGGRLDGSHDHRGVSTDAVDV